MLSCYRPRKAFSLAELLLALVILGVIAMFTIPKVLQGQQDNGKKAVFREVLSALSEVMYRETLLMPTSAWHNGTGQAYTQQILSSRLNHIKMYLDATPMYGSVPPSVSASTSPGVCFTGHGLLIANGAIVHGIGSSGGYGSNRTLLIDWNGTAPPNEIGDDMLLIITCWNTQAACGTPIDSPVVPLPRATMQPHLDVAPAYKANNDALYFWIFK